MKPTDSGGKTALGQADTVEIPALAPSEPARVRFELAARTHVGKVRPNNEDHYLIARARKALEVIETSLPSSEAESVPDEEGFLLLVADGIGGQAAGEKASALVVNEVQRLVMHTIRWFFHLGDPDEAERAKVIQQGLEHLDRQLLELGDRDPSLQGLGTTLTVAGLVGSELSVVHVGDSRAYLLRGGRLEQLTRDHTVAQKLADAGIIPPEQARTHRGGHALTNALGGGKPGVHGDIRRLPLQDGDQLLLCTDGLTDLVSGPRIEEILHAQANVDQACAALVDAALAAGGRDNITVVLAACTIRS